MMKKVRTRIAPSPTGNLHIGTVRTALFNFLFAKHEDGEFIIRIEDTDKERNEKKYEEDILEGLSWLNLTHDALYRQSEHVARHTEVLEELLHADKAYISREPKKDDPQAEALIVRLRNPNVDLTFTDLIRGDITFNTKDLGDFVIARSMTEPLYHLAVVVDDYDAGITHVIRGDDHISNTPRQILIGEALNFERPQYAHIPLILSPDRTKLSKRKGAVSLCDYRNKGYISEAITNYLALLGWNPGTEQEIFSLDELCKIFSLEKIQKGGAIFNQEKLDWFNKEYLRKLPLEQLTMHITKALPQSVKELTGYNEERVLAIAPALAERISRFDEITALGETGELDYYFSAPEYIPDALLPTKGSATKEETAYYLEEVLHRLHTINDEHFVEEKIKDALWSYANEKGRSAVLWPMRFALSGKPKSPDPFSLAHILGKEETHMRLEKAIAMLRKNA